VRPAKFHTNCVYTTALIGICETTMNTHLAAPQDRVYRIGQPAADVRLRIDSGYDSVHLEPTWFTYRCNCYKPFMYDVAACLRLHESKIVYVHRDVISIQFDCSVPFQEPRIVHVHRHVSPLHCHPNRQARLVVLACASRLSL